MEFNVPKKKVIQYERILQMAVVCKLRNRTDYNRTFGLYHGANEGQVRPQYRQILIAMGQEPGQPDLEFYIYPGKVIFIELKYGKRTSKVDSLRGAQSDRHRILKALGFECHVVKDNDHEVAYARICDLLSL